MQDINIFFCHPITSGFNYSYPPVCLGYFTAQLVWNNNVVDGFRYVIKGILELLFGQKAIFAFYILQKGDSVNHITSATARSQSQMDQLMEQ